MIKAYRIYRKDHRVFLVPDSQLGIGVRRSVQVQIATSHQPFHTGLFVTIQGPSIPFEVDSTIFAKGGP